jgi:hypothetical protein
MVWHPEELNFRQHSENLERSKHIVFTNPKKYAADTLTTAVLKYKYGWWLHKDLTIQPAISCVNQMLSSRFKSKHTKFTFTNSHEALVMV